MGVKDIELGEELVDALIYCVFRECVIQGGEVINVPESEGDNEKSFLG